MKLKLAAVCLVLTLLVALLTSCGISAKSLEDWLIEAGIAIEENAEAIEEKMLEKSRWIDELCASKSPHDFFQFLLEPLRGSSPENGDGRRHKDWGESVRAWLEFWGFNGKK